MLANELRIGDVIREPGGSTTEVKQIDFNACSSKGVHVNRKSCYDWNAPVQLSSAAKSDTGMGLDITIEDGLSKESPFGDKALFDRFKKQNA